MEMKIQLQPRMENTYDVFQDGKLIGGASKIIDPRRSEYGRYIAYWVCGGRYAGYPPQQFADTPKAAAELLNK